MSAAGQTYTLSGERIGRLGTLRLGCSAVLFDADRQQVLLTRRTDNGLWCLPGGSIEPGETVAEACEREVGEETGLQVRVRRLTGVYSNRDRLIVYPDGNRVQVVALNFLVEYQGGQMRSSAEVSEVRFWPVAEAVQMDLFDGHAERIRDALRPDGEVCIR
ncbi:MAG: NUDIX domain-containing protein [Anaerolineales bacterium]